MERRKLRVCDLLPEARLQAVSLGFSQEDSAMALYLRLLPEVPEHGDAQKLAEKLGIKPLTAYKWVSRVGRSRAYFHAAEGRRRARIELREQEAAKRRARHEKLMESWRNGEMTGRKADDTAARLRRKYGAEAVPYRNIDLAIRHAERRNS